jgi:type II secretory pathway pseudopilin PulG
VRPSAHAWNRAPAAACRAFTLVELVTAASLMTIMMLGVVQVFAIITKTAADAEGLSFAQQQARALFDRLHDDLRGMTREGYLCIKHNTYLGAPGSTTEYACDTLAFVTIGPCSSSWAKAPPYSGGAAEVVYTNNVVEPDYYNTKKSANDPGDPRKGVLGRGQWIWRYDGATGGTADDSGDLADRPYSTGTVNYLCDMFAAQPDWGNPALDRVKNKPAPSGAKIGYLKVWPWTAVKGVSVYPQSLRRVIASCVSEFYVESFNPIGVDRGPEATQTLRMDWIEDTYRWGSRFTSHVLTDVHRPGSSTNPDTNTPDHTLKSWPRALRVTVAIHDPGDTKPPRAGATATRFQGYAFQETFWITDP